jgi:hypothetical protein
VAPPRKAFQKPEVALQTLQVTVERRIRSASRCLTHGDFPTVMQGTALTFRRPLFRSPSRQAPTCFGARRDSELNRKLFPASGVNARRP